MTKKKSKKSSSTPKGLEKIKNFHSLSYEAGVSHGKTKALYLIKLCLDGYAEAYSDEKFLEQEEDEVARERMRESVKCRAAAADFILGYVSSMWDAPPVPMEDGPSASDTAEA
jgi:hypothetical protein